MSELVPQTGGTTVMKSSTSSSMSMSSSSSTSSSSTTKVVKQSASSVQSSSSSTSSRTSSSSVTVKSSGQSYSDRMAGDFGIDMGKEVEKLRLKMSEEMTRMHGDRFRLMPITGSTDMGSSLVRLDSDSIKNYIDQAHGDRVKLDFDVNEFEAETISVKTVGNKIEVHATKKSKKGDEERSEEFSRVYELPSSHDVDPLKVTSSIYKDGVLTIELPVDEALAGTHAAS